MTELNKQVFNLNSPQENQTQGNKYPKIKDEIVLFDPHLRSSPDFCQLSKK